MSVNIRINPLDLKPNKAIGISLPLNGNTGFSLTYNTTDQIKSNIKNLVLTNKGERVMQPNFGCNLTSFLFENKTFDTEDTIKEIIKDQIELWLPYVGVNDIQVQFNDQQRSIMVKIYFYLGDPTKIETVSFTT